MLETFRTRRTIRKLLLCLFVLLAGVLLVGWLRHRFMWDARFLGQVTSTGGAPWGGLGATSSPQAPFVDHLPIPDSWSAPIEVVFNGREVTATAMRQIAGNPRVHFLTMWSCQLPPDWAEILSRSHLRSLSIQNSRVLADGKSSPDSHSPIANEAATQLAKLDGLKYLTLVNTEIDDQGASLLLKNPRISFLNLPSSRVTGSCLTHFPESDLRLVSLDQCFFRGIDSGVEDLAPMNRLSLIGANALLPAGRGFPNTYCIDLTNAKLNAETMIALGRNTYVRRLELNGCSIPPGGLAEISKMKELTTLDLSHAICAYDQFEVLPALEKLEIFECSGTSIRESCVARILENCAIRVLQLEYTSVTDDIIPAISKETTLGLLYLRGTQISREAAVQLQESLPDCKIHHDSLPNPSWW